MNARRLTDMRRSFLAVNWNFTNPSGADPLV